MLLQMIKRSAELRQLRPLAGGKRCVWEPDLAPGGAHARERRRPRLRARVLGHNLDGALGLLLGGRLLVEQVELRDDLAEG